MADEPWFGEPTIITGPDGQPILAEVRTCTGYVISGGALVHEKPCPVHAEATPDGSQA